MKMRVAALAVLALGLPALAQERTDEVKLKFSFKDASLDAVLQYVASRTNWIFVVDKTVTGRIEAVSDAEVPVSKCLEFLDSALRRHGAITFNPYAPALPKPGQIVRIVDAASGPRTIEIHLGADPDNIPVTDRVRTQIIPLKAVSVTEVQKELGEVLRKAIEPDGHMAISTYSNSVVLTGRSDGINRAARILRVIDVSTSAELKIRVFVLRYSDAKEMAATLNEVFKREAMKADMGSVNPMQGFWRMFGGRGGGGDDRGGPQPRALASEMVRITADQRTNSVIVSATEENMNIIEDLIRRLDEKGAEVIKLKLYALRYADATSAAKLINDTFAETSSGAGSGQAGRGGRGGGPIIPVWMGGQPSQPRDIHAAKVVRAVADVRTNSVLVAASEQNLLLIDDLMGKLDRQVSDILEVKIYRLQNADPAEMAAILQALFRPQVQATQQSGRVGAGQQTQQGGGFFQRMMGMAGGGAPASSGGGLPPSQEVEITYDTRTRSVIAKASREYIAVMDEVVRQLDADPTEQMSTFVVRLRNHTASELAGTLQNLTRTTGTGSGQTRASQQQGLFGGQQLFGGSSRTTGVQSTRSSTRSSTGGTRSTGTRIQRLGPLQDEGPGAAGIQDEPQDEEMPRRAIEGQVDVQADPTTNSLVIRTSPRNFQAIHAMLQDLDRMRPQVLIKVLIADITLDERTQFGVEGFWENKWKVRGGDKSTNRFGTDFTMPAQGFTYLLSGDEFQASLKAFASEGKLRVLATPRIMVLDNQTADINVGKEVPIITNSTINSLGNPVNTVQYQSIGIMLQVTPHINPDGLVTMLVSPEISDIASAAESVEITPGATSPTFNVNRASTTVAVRSGTTIAIGGLIRETSDDSVQKLPILGDIPVIGALFSSTTKVKTKRELMIFLTPYVAFTAAEIEEITEIEKSRLKILDMRDIDSESDRWLERVRF